jgi:putative flippase GtrA
MLASDMHRPLHARRILGRWVDQGGRIGWFILVGSVAALVHWLVVVALVGRLEWHPLVANVAGWLVAFGVSFGGHHRATFRGHGGPVGDTARRFFMVSAGGFAINESSYALLMHWSGHRYDVLLAIVLVAVAFLTYLLSRHWAFLNTAAR